MNMRIVRSGSSTVKIPQIGARIDPGLFSEGYVTNVEGILIRFRDILHQILRDIESSDDTNENRMRVIEFIELLGGYIHGNFPQGQTLTLIIEDPLGNSAIISEEEGDFIKEPLKEDEVAEILSSKQEKDIIKEL